MAARLGIVTPHPIQYQAPWFRELARRPEVELVVLFASLPNAVQQGTGFGVPFQWDIPLLDGYPSRALLNQAPPGATGFWRCDTPELKELVAQFDAVVIHGWGVKSCLQGLIGCRRRGVPCIIHAETTLLRRRSWAVRLVHRALLSQFAAALAIGQANRAFYLAHGVRPETIFLAPYAVDNARFEREAQGLLPERPALRNAFGVPEGAVCVLYCGKFIDEKRPMDLLRALASEPARAARLHLLAVGDGARRVACEAFARSHGVPARFTGFLNQSEIVKAYVASDVLVLPSGSETWGLVVNEAMACGRPAIVSDRVGCQLDLVPDDRTGSVFPVGDITAIAARILEMARPGRLEAAGAAAREHVRQYSMARRAEATVSCALSVARRA
jgi:glycosyltransferase involved in cell wall biosynthesis